jgi:cytochrome c oxidase subunit 1
MPRRMAFYDYADPAMAGQALAVIASVAGGAVLVISGALFIAVLIKGQFAARAEPGQYRFAVAVHPAARVPAALNGFALWVSLMVVLTIVNYGFPIAHLISLKDNAVPVIRASAG